MTYLPFLRERSPQYQAFSPIKFTSEKLGIPKPKFKIGDRVKHRYICDNSLDTENYLKLQINYGLIIWMAPNPLLSTLLVGQEDLFNSNLIGISTEHFALPKMKPIATPKNNY